MAFNGIQWHHSIKSKLSRAPRTLRRPMEHTSRARSGSRSCSRAFSFTRADLRWTLPLLASLDVGSEAVQAEVATSCPVPEEMS